MAGEAEVGEAAGALPSVGPAGAAARHAAVAAAWPTPQWLAANRYWWVAAAVAVAVRAGAQVGAGRAGAAVGVMAPPVGVMAPLVGAVVMVGPRATVAAIP